MAATAAHLRREGPHGSVAIAAWLIEQFKGARTGEIPQLLSDDPNDQNRVNALEQHFRRYPAVFGRFSATALTTLE